MMLGSRFRVCLLRGGMTKGKRKLVAAIEEVSWKSSGANNAASMSVGFMLCVFHAMSKRRT